MKETLGWMTLLVVSVCFIGWVIKFFYVELHSLFNPWTANFMLLVIVSSMFWSKD